MDEQLRGFGKGNGTQGTAPADPGIEALFSTTEEGDRLLAHEIAHTVHAAETVGSGFRPQDP